MARIYSAHGSTVELQIEQSTEPFGDFGQSMAINDPRVRLGILYSDGSCYTLEGRFRPEDVRSQTDQPTGRAYVRSLLDVLPLLDKRLDELDTPALILADWLDERGHGEAANELRAHFGGTYG